MIKNILWDFDGVILDSMKIKGDGFVELFSKYENNKVKLLEEYHYANGGLSRFEKIRYFFVEIIKKDVSQNEIDKLAYSFSKIIEKKIYNKTALINESLFFIKNKYKLFNFHIVSGSEHHELLKLCNYFKLSDYFISILGSPIKKEFLVKRVLEDYNYKKNETILIGDSFNDLDAAKSNNIKFYGYNNEHLKKNADYFIESFDNFIFE